MELRRLDPRKRLLVRVTKIRGVLQSALDNQLVQSLLKIHHILSVSDLKPEKLKPPSAVPEEGGPLLQGGQQMLRKCRLPAAGLRGDHREGHKGRRKQEALSL